MQDNLLHYENVQNKTKGEVLWRIMESNILGQGVVALTIKIVKCGSPLSD